MSLNISSITVYYKNNPIKIENGKVYLKAFGTTCYNQSMHFSWVEVKVSDLKKDVIEFLNVNKLLTK